MNLNDTETINQLKPVIVNKSGPVIIIVDDADCMGSGSNAFFVGYVTSCTGIDPHYAVLDHSR